MKVLDKRLEKIMSIMSWSYILDDVKKDAIEKILSAVYDSGYADGYAQGLRDGCQDGG